jgi:hypothetical protein
MDNDNDELHKKIEVLLGRPLNEEELGKIKKIPQEKGASKGSPPWLFFVAMQFAEELAKRLNETQQQSADEAATGKQQPSEPERKTSCSAGKTISVEKGNPPPLELSFPLLACAVSALFLLLVDGSLMLWAGICLGKGKVMPPVWLLKMPVGILLSPLLVAVGIYCGIRGGKYYSKDAPEWRKWAAVSATCLLGGSILLGLTFS